MKAAILITRTLLGLGFIIFGLNILHPFLPAPAPVEGSLPAQFMAVMFPTKWMALVGAVQLLGGLLVLLGRTAPLGLVLLAPVLVNILAFHIFLEGGKGLAPGLVFTAMTLFLFFAYRKNFTGILTVHASPN